MIERGRRPWVGGLSVVVAMLLSAGCDIFDDDDDVITNSTVQVTGSGVVAEESRSVSGFSGVSFTSEGIVRIDRTGAESLLVRAEDNLLQYLLSDVHGGMLDLRTEAGMQIDPTMPIEFVVTASALDRVDLVGAGDVHATGATAPLVRMTLSGVGDLYANDVDASELAATLSGVGGITSTGSATLHRVTLSGTGDYDGIGVSSVDAQVVVSGQGSVTLSVSGTLNVTISGSGNVFYSGSPVVTKIITGSGRVEQLSP